MPGFQLPGGALDDELPGGALDDEPPELPADVELDEQEPPDGELVETNPIYLLQPKRPGQPTPPDDLDDMKETIVQQDPPSMGHQMGFPEDDAATMAVMDQQPPPGPFDPQAPVPHQASQSWSRGEAPYEQAPGPLSAELTAEVSPDDFMVPVPRRRKGRDTRELERQLKRRPIWLWIVLGGILLGGVGAALYTFLIR